MAQEPIPDNRLLTMRIIHGALCIGVTTMTAVLVGLRIAKAQPPTPVPILSYLGVGLAVLCLVLSFILPNLLAAGWRKQVASGQSPFPKSPEPGQKANWSGLFQNRLVVGMALLEGAAFFQVIAYFVEGWPLSVGIVLGLLVAMLARFPTRSAVQDWGERQQELVQELKMNRR